MAATAAPPKRPAEEAPDSPEASGGDAGEISDVDDASSAADGKPDGDVASESEIEEEISDEALLARVRSLEARWDATSSQLTTTEQSVNNLDVQIPCVMCKLRYRDSFLVPCGHATVCSRCAEALDACPLCNELVHSTKPRIKSTREVEQLLSVLAANDIKNKPSGKGGHDIPEDISAEDLAKFKLERLFMHFDDDDSGYIDKNELQQFMKQFIYQGLELSEGDLIAALELVDTNGDGQVDPEEFYAFIDDITQTMSPGDFDKALNAILDSKF
jgi:EF-hand domain pair/Zinc finger, C3HC4 type (RING finger)